MHLFYTISIYLYGIGIRIASLFNPKAKEWLRGRKNFFRKLPTLDAKPVYWFHCASLGEFDQGLPVMNKLKELHPDIFLLVTFFSPSGYLNYHKRQHSADFVCYLPLDTPRNATRFIDHFKPEKVFFIKYEFWGNYILKAHTQGSKLYSIAAIFRPDHRFFKWYGGFFRKLLVHFEHLYVQNQQSVKLLKSIGINQVSISGDTRFDRVIENKQNLKPNELIELFLGREKALVLGSSWPVDEEMIIPLINSGKIKGKLIIAPHDVSEKHILEIEQRLNVKHRRYTTLDLNQDIKEIQVLIIDTVGQLANAYAYGQIAYVGGGFTGKLHNILEPAVFGLPVLFGPKHERFPEAEMYIREGIGFTVSNRESFLVRYDAILKDIVALSEKTVAFVESNAGATDKIIDSLGRIEI